MSFPPNTFASQAGQVPASQLDANFLACQPASAPTLTIVGNATGGTANNTNLTPSQAYGIIKSAIPFEVVSFMGGVQGGSAWQVMRYQPSTNVILVQTSCYSSSGVAATGSTTFTIADNGSTIGTIVFSASGSTGAVTITGTPYTLAAGHILTVTGPGSADATLANMNITLGGVRG